jgi:hypothetical protein
MASSRVVGMIVLALAGVAALSARPADAHGEYRQELPNIPAVNGAPWPGVGHTHRSGGGQRNAFGRVSGQVGRAQPSLRCRDRWVLRWRKPLLQCVVTRAHVNAISSNARLTRMCGCCSARTRHGGPQPPCAVGTCLTTHPPVWPLRAPSQHFAAAGYTWTRELCQADDDGDGFSNGAELGDPDCRVRTTWCARHCACALEPSTHPRPLIHLCCVPTRTTHTCALLAAVAQGAARAPRHDQHLPPGPEALGAAAAASRRREGREAQRSTQHSIARSGGSAWQPRSGAIAAARAHHQHC